MKTQAHCLGYKNPGLPLFPDEVGTGGVDGGGGVGGDVVTGSGVETPKNIKYNRTNYDSFFLSVKMQAISRRCLSRQVSGTNSSIIIMRGF